MGGMSIPTTTVAALPDDAVLVDVREDDEWAAGHIEGATHIPLQELPARLGELPEGQTLVVCKVGARSARAVAWLAQQGRDVVNLDGGMLDWETAGREMVSDTGQRPVVV
jgi:rhodanese-related sulfurtransferase